MRILDIGSGINSRIYEFYDKNNYFIHLDQKLGFDIETEYFPEGNWDIIFCNHIIEHLNDTDDFLRKCKMVMNKNTILEIATPNLCAWFNRILFLFGYLPHSYEVSKHINAGKIHSWSFEELGGHKRVFNLKSMVEILEFHGFRIIDITGEKSTYPCNAIINFMDKIMSRNPDLASSFRIKCQLSY